MISVLYADWNVLMHRRSESKYGQPLGSLCRGLCCSQTPLDATGYLILQRFAVIAQNDPLNAT